MRHLRRTGGAPNVPIPPQLKAIAYCESKGNPRAVSSTGKYRGLFQFDYRTWATVGGTGRPGRRAGARAVPPRRDAVSPRRVFALAGLRPLITAPGR